MSSTRRSIPKAPATASAHVVSEIIRGKIGFGGLLFSDDLSMQALSGGLRERAAAAFAAGIDIALHCNGDLAEASAVAAATPELSGAALARAIRASETRATAKAAQRGSILWTPGWKSPLLCDWPELAAE